MPSLSLMGLNGPFSQARGGCAAQSWRRLQFCRHILPLGPLCSTPLDVGREAADPSAESTAARVGDGMAEWSACERIADVTTVGPGGAPFRGLLSVGADRHRAARARSGQACFGRGRGWSLWTLSGSASDVQLRATVRPPSCVLAQGLRRGNSTDLAAAAAVALRTRRKTQANSPSEWALILAPAAWNLYGGRPTEA